MPPLVSSLISLAIPALICYLSGAIPTGYWLGLAYGKDLTELGSKSIGATNALRLLGRWQALLVLTLDILKGFIPIFYFKNFSNLDSWLVLLLTLIPILAHSKSIFVKFKGGKSSATGLGVLIAINPLVAVITFTIWFICVKLSGYSSLGSIICIPLVPLWLWLAKEELPMIIFGVIAFIYIVLIKHRANIKRLLNGTEPKISENKE